MPRPFRVQAGLLAAWLAAPAAAATIFDPPAGSVAPGCGEAPDANGREHSADRPPPRPDAYCIPLEQVRQLREMEQRYLSLKRRFELVGGGVRSVKDDSAGKAASGFFAAANGSMERALSQLRQAETEARTRPDVDISAELGAAFEAMRAAGNGLDDSREAAGLPRLVPKGGGAGLLPGQEAFVTDWEFAPLATAVERKKTDTSLGNINWADKTLRTQVGPAGFQAQPGAAPGREAPPPAEPPPALAAAAPAYKPPPEKARSAAAASPAASPAPAQASGAPTASPAPGSSAQLAAPAVASGFHVQAQQAEVASWEPAAPPRSRERPQSDAVVAPAPRPEAGRPLEAAPLPEPEKARDQLALAKEAAAQGKHRAAERHAQASTTLNPASAESFELLAWSQIRLKRFTAALASAKAAVALAPERARAHVLVAIASQGLGLQREAVAALETAARLDARYRPMLQEAKRSPEFLTSEALDDELFLSDLLHEARPLRGTPWWLMLALVAAGAAAGALWPAKRRAAPASKPADAPASDRPTKYGLDRLVARWEATELWEATDRSLGRGVTIQKLIAAKGERSRKAALDWAKRAGALLHPGLIGLYEIVELADEAWLVFERVPGTNVADRIRKSGPLTLTGALALLEQVGSALEFAHRHGVAHGRLTPASILVAEGGIVKLHGLGLTPGAKPADDVKALADCLKAMVSPTTALPDILAASATPSELLKRAQAAKS